MKATPLHAAPEATESAPRLDPDADAYMWRLVKEQNRFLDALGEAASLLSSNSLGRAVAVQNRLTQEFLDAQRAIVRRRAETDALVGDIERNAPGGRGSVPFPSPAVVPAAPSFAPPHGWPVPTAAPWADLAELARLVDEAFEPGDVDSTTMRRQLRELLDEWWRNENQENQATIDDARARAAVWEHRTSTRPEVTVARPVAESRPADPVVTASSSIERLPPLVAALESAGHQDLDELLASLLASLEEDEAADADDALVIVQLEEPPALPTPSSQPVLPPTLPPRLNLMSESLTDAAAAPQEAFDRFWGAFAHRSGGGRDWMFAPVLLPAVAVISVLALVLAVVG